MSVSIIIPAAGTDDHLWRLALVLESITLQTVKPVEVVVVRADNHKNYVKAVCQEFKQCLPLKYSSLSDSTKCFRAGEARNEGVKSLSKEISRLLFVDDDCVLSPDTVEVHSRAKADEVFAGARKHVNPEKLVDRTLRSVFNANYQPDKRQHHRENWHTYECCYTCHLSIGSSVFDKVGGFWEEMAIGEDRDLGMRAMRAGCRVKFLPTHCVFHIDHPVRRPLGPKDLPAEVKLLVDSIKLPGYFRN